ncbi:lysM and putative peptidoglycan-binding domain-containing protein 2 [Microcaecilia unicolor]|uniref:LysM and putative peptidoglycan-binding domain-containing protein 2 n=1 Tax=Microcaecilia unicolor TaxID=1415580 RepID=A0A6P7X6R0_9AMPH|nr:lysM and putative peptidoglycan-binding domain-containing protein 2 [Microcaecilia unicolor]
MADASPSLHTEGGSGRFGSPVFPRSGSGSGSESEAELSQSLARTKTRSYGSTASVTAPLTEQHYVEHRVGDGDTLQGIALKYGVTMQQIKRANKLFTTDCIFLRKTLNIPVISEKKSLFNGLNLLDSPENESLESCTSWDKVSAQEETSSSPSPQEPDYQLTEPEELSAKDFLQRLDLQIKLSTQAAKKLKEDDIRCADDVPYATSSYHQ